MKKYIVVFVLALISFTSFAQSKASSESIMQLMTVKNGMNEITQFTKHNIKHISTKNKDQFEKTINSYKVDLVNKSLEFFKNKYTAAQINAIYTECTSDIIDYTDLTNGFFRDWRKLKGDLFHRHTKEIIRKNR